MPRLRFQDSPRNVARTTRDELFDSSARVNNQTFPPSSDVELVASFPPPYKYKPETYPNGGDYVTMQDANGLRLYFLPSAALESGQISGMVPQPPIPATGDERTRADAANAALGIMQAGKQTGGGSVQDSTSVLRSINARNRARHAPASDRATIRDAAPKPTSKVRVGHVPAPAGASPERNEAAVDMNARAAKFWGDKS